MLVSPRLNKYIFFLSNGGCFLSFKEKQANTPHSSDFFGEAREYWWNEDYLALLADRLELHDCQQMADIGCGQGMMALRFAPYLPAGASVWGLDLEKTHIKKARQKARSAKALSHVHFHFEEGDAHQLPFEGAAMDFTYCQTLLIHVENPAEILAEMKRVTRKEGFVVAMEPNNLVPQLMIDRLRETDYDIDHLLDLIEVRLRCERGKKRLGEGYNSLGDVLPELFVKAGLKDIQVWMSDKALSLIPPYDSREKRVRMAQMIEWIQNGNGGIGYEQNLRYYKAGGGKKVDFDQYWQRISQGQSAMLEELMAQDYITAGGSVMYVVAGRV